MAAENPTWGAPRIHGEIQKLGLEVSERTVSRSMPRRPAHPDARQRWRTCLANHREVITAMDFFTVPTVTFRVLYVFFIVHHARRTLIHVRVTGHPTAAWITQQLRETFPYDQAPHYLILDRDAKYGHEIPSANQRMGIKPKQITARSPWQNGVAERFLGTARGDPLDHVIVLNEKQLQRLLAGFVSYDLDDGTHLSLTKDAPAMRDGSRSPIQPPRSSLDLALADFVTGTAGVPQPDASARIVHRSCFVAEHVYSCGRQSTALYVNRWA